MQNEFKVIPASVVKLSEAIKEAIDNKQTIGISIVRKRRAGIMTAIELAKTENAEFEIIKPKQLTNGETHTQGDDPCTA